MADLRESSVVEALTTERVRVEHEGGIATITLTQEHRRNPLSGAMIDDLRRAVEGSAEAHAIVLTSTGQVWSTGHDLKEMASLDEPALRELLERCTGLMRAIETSPQPIVAKVAGLATAAGCQLVASCDVVVASETARFCTPGGKGGLFCHTPMVAVARSIGRKRAAELAMTGDEIDAATAADWGLVNRVVPDDELDAATDDMVRRLTRGSRYGKRIGKQVLYRQMDEKIDDAYAMAIEVMAANAATGDGHEGALAFAEKRRPEFTHEG